MGGNLTLSCFDRQHVRQSDSAFPRTEAIEMFRMVRIPLGSDPITKKRNYYNRTIHGSFRQAQAFLNRKMNEWGTNRQTDGGKIRLNQDLDQWLKTIKPEFARRRSRPTQACSKSTSGLL